MKTKFVCAVILCFVLAACHKQEKPAASQTAFSGEKPGGLCSNEIITDKPIRAGETGHFLPAGTSLCFSPDELEISIRLPEGFHFLATREPASALPVPIITYKCDCSSNNGTACKVFFVESLGFGCLQSSCQGSCTGRFSYGGYVLDRIEYTGNKADFFESAAVQGLLAAQLQDAAAKTAIQGFCRQELFGVPYYVVFDEGRFRSKATCDCEGTQACTLKELTLLGKKVYFCEGTCNGCELTIP